MGSRLSGQREQQQPSLGEGSCSEGEAVWHSWNKKDVLQSRALGRDKKALEAKAKWKLNFLPKGEE